MEPAPEMLMSLLPFQKEFLAWAVDQERSEIRGGILADEMGMGKTIQVFPAPQAHNLFLGAWVRCTSRHTICWLWSSCTPLLRHHKGCSSDRMYWTGWLGLAHAPGMTIQRQHDLLLPVDYLIGLCDLRPWAGGRGRGGELQLREH